LYRPWSIHQLRGEREKADAYLLRAYRGRPNDPYINMNMGLYHLDGRRPEKALYHFRRSLRDRRLAGKVYLYMGVATMQMGMAGEAASLFKKAADREPKNIAPHLYLAEIYWKAGDEEAARREVKKVTPFMMRNESLFSRTMDLILGRGHSGRDWLSSDILLPLLAEAFRAAPAGRDAWQRYMEKTLEKDRAIEYDK
jgi:Flp pilus assembly protein TadD